jgi:LuxR family maltose regulon positive regulatory protein
VRDFVLHIAILSRLDAAACQAVTATPARRTCQRLLEELERANLFLVPLDEERRWYRLHDLFREAVLAALEQTHPDLAPTLHRRAASFYAAQSEWAEAIVHRLAAADFESAAGLMEETVEHFWVRGEAASMTRWVLALPQPVVRQHARLALTVALYLLNTVTYATAEQRVRTHAEVRQLMARVEAALGPRVPAAKGAEASRWPSAPDPEPPTNSSRTEERQASAAEDALLRRRLRALRLNLDFLEASARGDLDRLRRMQPEIEEIQDALDRDAEEEPIWQLVRLFSLFELHYIVRQEGAQVVPQLLEAKRRASQSGSQFATVKIMQYLALAALEDGKLRLAFEESRAALDLIEQIAGYAVLKGYFEMVQIEALYQWNRLEEARSRLHAVLDDATMRQHLDVLGGSYLALLRVEVARGDQSAAEAALRGLEDLVGREGFGTYPGVLPSVRALWWLARGQLADAAAWAATVDFHDGTWENSLYFDFRIVMRTYFAQHRWAEALALLERWRGQLDHPGNSGVAIMFLTQWVVALHQTGHGEQAHEVAERLFALTEPEGYLRMYLDEGEPMRQALRAFLPSRAGAHPLAPSAARGAHAAYVSTLLAAFKRQQPHQGPSLESRVPGAPAPTLSLTRREQEVLRLLADGASNQEIAQTLMVELSTVKKHVSNLLGKLHATNRTQVIAQARARALL